MNGNGRRRPWPMNERDPGALTPGGLYPDVCPPYIYPKGGPSATPPPLDRPNDPCPPGFLMPEEEAKICRAARVNAKEIANYAFNPYQFPTPFSQDFDIVGENSVVAVGGRFILCRFQIPKGYVGVLEAVGVEMPVALNTFIAVHPVINDGTVKTFERQVFVGARPLAAPPTVTPGVNYQIGTLSEPRRMFHPIQEEMFVGVDVEALAGAAPMLPATIRAVIRGRYWLPTIATRYWTFAKGD